MKARLDIFDLVVFSVQLLISAKSFKEIQSQIYKLSKSDFVDFIHNYQEILSALKFDGRSISN